MIFFFFNPFRTGQKWKTQFLRFEQLHKTYAEVTGARQVRSIST